MKQLFFSGLLLLLITGCKSSEVSPVETELFGTWYWLSTDGGIGNHIHDTPENTGNTMQLKLHQNQRYALFKNDRKLESGRFQITQKRSLLLKKQASFISIDENPNDTGNVVYSGIIYLEKKDTLTISRDVYDGVGSSFKRIK